MDNNFNKTEKQWQSILTPEQYAVLRQKNTEPAFSGALLENKDKGMYVCAACGQELFASDTKFDSGCGWPSFWQAIDAKKINLIPDHSFGLDRTEVVCARCGSHLGHLFNDGPAPTGLCYCINSLSLKFNKAGK